MSEISLKSISGITSITTPAGVDNQFTLHNNNTTEAVKLDTAGNLHFHNHLNITGVSTASNFKTGTSNLHNTGLNVQDLDVDGHTNLDNVSIAGVTTTSGNIIIENAEPSLFLTDTNGNPDYKIFNDQGAFKIYDTTYSAVRLQIGPTNGEMTVLSNTNFPNGITMNPGTASVVNTIAQRLGDTDTKIRFPANDTFTVETAGSERLRINSTGQIITNGNANPYPTRGLTIRPNTSQTHNYLSIIAGNTSSVSGVTFGTSPDNDPNNYRAMFEYYHSGFAHNEGLRFLSAGTEALRIRGGTAAGDLLYGPGDHHIGASPGLINGLGSHNNANPASVLFGINDGGGYNGMKVINFDDGTYNSQRIEFLTGKGGISMATVRMGIDENGLVSIGRTISANSSFNASTNQLVVGNGVGNQGMVIYTGASHSGNIIFNDVADGSYQGGIIYKHGSGASDNQLRFYTNASQRFTITKVGDLLQTWRDGAFIGIKYDSDYYMGLTFGASSRTLFIDNRSNDTRADIVFRTIEAQSAPQERLRINSSGNITQTGSTFTIDSSASAGLSLDRANTSTGATVDFKTAGALKWYMGLRGLVNDNFYIRNESGSSDALTILTDGKVGIKESTPAYTLESLDSGHTRHSIICSDNNSAGIYGQVMNGSALVGNFTARVDGSGNYDLYTGTSTGILAHRVKIASGYGNPGRITQINRQINLTGLDQTNLSDMLLARMIQAHDMSRASGTSVVTNDSRTNTGIAIIRNSGSDNNTFFFGPYGYIEAGTYTAMFRMKTSTNSGSNPVVYLDVVGNGIANPRGRGTQRPRTRTIYPNNFTDADQYQYFYLDFDVQNPPTGGSSNNYIETRALSHYPSRGHVSLDHVLIIPRSVTYT